jgi:hypothetical protein
LTINFDGSLQLQGAGAGILVMPPKEESFKYASWSMDHHGTWHLPLKVVKDSLLVVNQANKEWSCLDDKMLMYS